MFYLNYFFCSTKSVEKWQKYDVLFITRKLHLLRFFYMYNIKKTIVYLI